MRKPVPRKRFGQHFLTDSQVLDRIIRAFSPQSNQVILEIGPGTGVLTEMLLEHVDHLVAVELDRDLAALLNQKFDPGKLTVIQQDVLTLDIESLFSGYANRQKIRIIGNLPYNISTPLLFHLIKNAGFINDMMFMLQKEVAMRLSAGPDNKHYGRLSVMSGLALQCECLFDVGPESFTPPPQVNSTVLRLYPESISHRIDDSRRLNNIVRQAFSQRRKTLKNSLKNLVSESQFLNADIDSSLRAEKLSVEQFIALSNA